MILTIKFTWTTRTPLRIHTGMARAGSVDRTVRARDRKPVLPGEAVKASIREAAERILRWQSKSTLAEKRDTSIPTHPALQRLFAPESVKGNYSAHASPARYYFRSCVASYVPSNDRMEITSTAINDETGTAQDNMLRTIELWRPGIVFDNVIETTGGDWRDGKPDRLDLSLLLMAITAVDAIGGGWGVGCGELGLSGLNYQVSWLPGQAIYAGFSKLAEVQSVFDAIQADTVPGAAQ